MTTTVADLQKNLKQEYDIVCFKDLSEVWHQHGAIFHLFDSLYQEVFRPNQRLVFYSNKNIPQSFLNHIQRAASQVDISNFFILFCVADDIQFKLVKANSLYGFDETPMQYRHVMLTDSNKFFEPGYVDSNSMCAYPFNTLQIKRDGKTAPCCKYIGNTGQINQDTTSSDIFFNDASINLRDQFKKNIKNSQCDVCWNQEKHGCKSHRQHSLNKYQKMLDREWIDRPALSDITISPSNICNFICRICNHHASSSIAAEEMKHAKSKERRDLIYKESTVSNILSFDIVDKNIRDVPNIRYLHILGGEPFLWPNLKQLLKNMIEQNQSKNCIIEFNTNGSVYPDSTIELLQQFRHCDILISLDNINEQFETERSGKWQSVLQNILNFKKLNKKQFSIHLAITVNIQNLMYLDKMLDFANFHELPIVWWYLEKPEYYCIDNITESMKQAVIEKLSNCSDPEIKSIVRRIKSIQPSDGQEFIQRTLELDSRRSSKFYNTHTETYHLMNIDKSKEPK